MRTWFVVMILLALVAPGCRKEGDGGGLQKVKLALNWVPEPEFGGIYAARQIGAFARNGLEVEIESGGAGAPVLQRVAAGHVPFGIAGADEVIMARSRGADVVAIFATYQTCPQGIMVHRARGLKDIGEVFKSGTVAMEVGLPYASFLKQKYGFSNVKIAPYDGGVARFLTDSSFAQQCFITSEPLAAGRKGADVQVFLVADAGYNPYTAVVIARGADVRAKPQVARALVAALREGWRAYLDNPAPVNQEMAQLNRAMDAQTFAAAAQAQKSLIETDETRQRGLGSMTSERWELLARQLLELKLVERIPSASECMVDVDQLQ